MTKLTLPEDFEEMSFDERAEALHEHNTLPELKAEASDIIGHESNSKVYDNTVTKAWLVKCLMALGGPRE